MAVVQAIKKQAELIFTFDNQVIEYSIAGYKQPYFVNTTVVCRISKKISIVNTRGCILPGAYGVLKKLKGQLFTNFLMFAV